MKLTALILPTLPPGDYPDQLVTGLIFKVGHRTRSWTIRYRSGEKRHRVQLGYFPKMGLLDARNAAKKALDRVEVGAPAVAAPVLHPRHALTLGDLIDKYERMRIKEGASGRSFAGGFRAVRSMLADFLNMPATQFAKADLRAARDKVAERAPSQSNRSLAYLSPIMRWAAQEDLIPHNFVGDLRKSPEAKRDRVLTRDEIAKIWTACDRLDGGPSVKAFGRMVQFALVTGQRRDECASLKFGDILDGTWRQATNKAKRPHAIPLPRLALELVGSGEARDLVFVGKTGKLDGFSKLKPKLDKLAGVSGWRLHDLRRTCATNLQDLGVDEMVIKSILNHAAVEGVSGVYMRSTLMTGKAAALEAWAAELIKISSSRASSSL